MVKGNPEFVRNLWLEITPYRLVMMPSVIGAIFLVAYLINDRVLDASTAKISAIMYAAIVLVWGSRVASEAVIQEINGRTWDSQRMSALGPLALGVGKLFGATVHVWYGGLICMGLYALSYGELIPTGRLMQLIALYVGAGILCHAIGLLVSLQAVQKRREFGRIQVTFYQFLGLLVVAPVLYIGLSDIAETKLYYVTTWYGHVSELLAATVLWLYIYVGWSLIGIWRSMRTELQMPNGPWVWLAFVAFAAVHVAGLRFLPEEVSRVIPTLAGRAFAGFAVLVILCYVAALSEPKGRLVFRRLRQSMRLGDWKGFLDRLPLSFPTLALMLIAAATLARIGPERITLFTFPINFRLMAGATALFVLRDICFVIYMNLLRPSPRADSGAFVLLALSYTLLPVALSGLGLDVLGSFFWPMRNAGAALTLLPPAGEVLAIGILLIHQWRRALDDDEEMY
jgi:hypothetical protein